jgi:hypothetical protein
MGIKTALLVFLFTISLSAGWTPGTVVSVATRTAQYRVPAAVEYTVRIDSTEYVVEQTRHMFASQGPKEIFAIGEAVQLSQDGESYVLLRTSTIDKKRLRIVRVVRH